MSIVQAILLGLIQGFTEFLPVSSSGHLVLFSRITGAESSLAFDLCLHLASLVAVIIVFRREMLELVRKPFSPLGKKLMLATALSVIAVVLLKDIAEQSFDGKSLPLFFMLTALLLTLSLTLSPKRGREMTYLDAAIVGLAQGLAVFPGLSRSGTTVSTATLLGVEREESTSFCFILSVPIILGSAIVGIGEGNMGSISPLCILLGSVSALVSGLIALKTAKALFNKANNKPFIIYLVALSVIITLNDLFLKAF